MSRSTIIHPVIMAVPENQRKLKARDKVLALKQAARKALYHCARYSGLTMGPLEKASNGAPLPSNGIHWSLTHKANYVAAVAALHPIGIDIEENRPCSPGLYERLAQPKEWNLAPIVNQTLFYRYWTAKEAVLKAVGKGLAGLGRCQVVTIWDDTHLELTYDETIWQVTQYWSAQNHIVSVTADNIEIVWHQLR